MSDTLDDQNVPTPAPNSDEAASGLDAPGGWLEARRNRRDSRGRWTAGNMGRLTTGERSEQLRRWIVEGDEHREMVQAIADDLGGPASLSTLAQETVERVAFSILLDKHSIRPTLARDGALTRKDRQKSAFRTHLQLSESIRKDSQLLGLERRARSIHAMSAAEWAAAQRATSDGGSE